MGFNVRIFCVALLACVLFTGHASAKRIRDTLHFKRSVAVKYQLVLSDSALNAIGIDSLLTEIEDIHNTLTGINNATATGFDTREISDALSEIDSNIGTIDENITEFRSVLDVKNLQMFEVLLKDLQEQLTARRVTLNDYHKELAGMNTAVSAFQRDTILRSLMADSAFRSLYIAEITDLDDKMASAKKAVSGLLAQVGQLQTSLSNRFFETIDLQNRIQELLKKTSIKSLGMEYDYLWKMHAVTDSEETKAEHKVRKSYNGQIKVLRYYFRQHQADQWYMLLTGILFAFWIFRNFKKIEKAGHPDFNVRSFLIIKKAALLPTLLVLFNLSPFFDIHPPTAYVDIMQLLLVAALTIQLARIWSKKLFGYWLAIVALFLTISILAMILTPTPDFRILLFVLNLVSAVFGIFWARTVRKNTFMFTGLLRVVSIVYIVLNVLAAFCNLFGRLSLAKIMSVTAIHSITQVVGLSIFIEIITEAFQLQTMVNRLKGGLSAKLNFTKIQGIVGAVLKTTAVCIWLIVFTISLNLYSLLFTGISEFMTQPRKIGSTTFELGSIFLFVGIIYISNLLQRGIGSLYGNDDSWDPEVKKNGSRLAMTRLVLIVIGFMVAVAASGLPIDKITIVLGALGVGIGLGLQTIVNNLVSGVILIFEQPFRIGDFIAVGDQKGRVLDIGIRSSKLVMEEGAEVILPNADLLSGKVVNWTMRNDYMRVELQLTVDCPVTFEALKQIVAAALASNDSLVKDNAVEVYLSSIKDSVMGLLIYVWIKDVHKQRAIKSELLLQLSKAFAEHEVKML